MRYQLGARHPGRGWLDPKGYLRFVRLPLALNRPPSPRTAVPGEVAQPTNTKYAADPQVAGREK